MANSGLNGALYWIRTSDRRLRRLSDGSDRPALALSEWTSGKNRAQKVPQWTKRVDRFRDLGFCEIASLMGVVL